jgi:hypothetical protein
MMSASTAHIVVLLIASRDRTLPWFGYSCA